MTSGRIKTFTFRPGSLTAASTGLFSVFSEHPINGVFDTGNYSANGSMVLLTSGTSSEQIWTFEGTADADKIAYPMIYAVDNSNTTGSPQAFVRRVVRTPLNLIGSGLGDGKSGLGFTIYYD